MAERRVAIQLISTGGVYGAERMLLELASYLAERGWDSRVVALEGRGATDLIRRAQALGLEAEAFVPSGRLAFGPLLRRTRQMLARHPRAIVHSHGYKPDIVLSILNVPQRLACLSTCHSWYRETLQLRLLEAIDKRVLRGFEHVAAVSGEIFDELARHGIAPQRLSLITNGISTPRASADARKQIRELLALPPDAKLVVQIGRLTRSKRNDLLIAAAAKLAESDGVHVLFVGEGDQSKALAKQVAEMGLEKRVRFWGYREDIPQVLAAADLLALTSDKEGLPIVLLEAMALQCPIVSTSVGEIPRALRDGQDGWLVPPEDLGALTTAIRDALAQPQLAKQRAANAQQEFLRRFSREAMGKRYLEIYEQAWASRGWPQ